MAENINIEDIRGILRRRKNGFFITFFSIFVIATVVAFVLPPIYMSKSTILIEEQQIPEDYVRSTITSYVEERLQGITQRIMSRTKLMEIMDQFNLYRDLRDRYTTEEILAKMREDIQLETISADVIDKRTGRPSAATIAFTLSYQGRDPATTQKVANVLTSLYLEENLKAREQRAVNTTQFLENELKNVQTRIDDLEARLGQFKQAHLGELPENNALNIEAVSRLERDMDQINTQLRSLEERKIYLKGQLAVVEPFQDKLLDPRQDPMAQKRMHLETRRLELVRLKTIVSEKHPDIKRLEQEIRELEAQVGQEGDPATRAQSIGIMEKELAEKKAQLGPKHPDVINLSKQVTALRQEADNPGEKPPVVATDTGTRRQPNNPAYISLATQIATTDMELQSLSQERDQVKAKIALYQKRLENAPALENEYLDIIRNLESARAMHTDISHKLMEARVSEGMEQAQKGERFTITEPAPFPEKPYKPNRVAIILIGFVLALGAGVGVGAIGESLDTSIKTANELKKIMDAPLYSVIPLVETDQERRRRWLKRAIWVVSALVAIAALLLVVDRYVMPLEILWVKLERRLMMAFPMLR